ncbi:MAG: ImmA/IrrE family metallo-endopeptidase [Treponemataceae bacterium]|nr:ImmA/IrrE family metallo-endopeptidase [Treponemataceae bacterium]
MKKILKGCDYDRIEEIANDLIEDLGLSLFPVNCFEVAFLLGIEIKKYSELPEIDRDFVVSKSKDGYSIKIGNKYIIYYNDELDRNRIKFTIWHEIAHIQLGHLETDCTELYALLEEEANHFAAFIMAPLALVHNLGLSNPVEIADVCEISFDCACNVYEHYIRAFRFPNIKNTILAGRIVRLLTYRPKEVA